jgi:predicted DNA-binding transcriptional regulator AlpA
MAQVKTLDEDIGTAQQLDMLRCEGAGTDARVEHLHYDLDLVPPEDFARALGLSEQTLSTWRAEKQGPDYIKLGKSVFYRRADLKRWIAQSRVNVIDDSEAKAA